MQENYGQEKSKFLKFKTIIISALVLICMHNVKGASHAFININEGDTPAAIVLEDINGNMVDTSSLTGKKPMIIVFWKITEDKSFINYSLDELLFLNDYYDRYHTGKDLEIIGVYIPQRINNIPQSEMVKVRQLVTANNIKFPIVIDRGLKIFSEYGVIALPSTVMVGNEGKIEYIGTSFPISAWSVFSKKIAALVDDDNKKDGRYIARK